MNSNDTPEIKEFESIVGLYRHRLFRFAFMRVGSREAAEDMVQDVFIRLYNRLSIGRVSNLEYYLLSSISNACIDYSRKKTLATTSLEAASEIAAENDREISEEYTRIKLLLDDLPFDQAETVRMKCYDGLKFRQIAELLGLPESTVKARYRYAITKIRQKIEKLY